MKLDNSTHKEHEPMNDQFYVVIVVIVSAIALYAALMALFIVII